MELTVPLESIYRLIARARELEADIPVSEDDDNGDPADSDDPYATVEDEADTAAEEEVRALLEELADDETTEVLALALVGRGTYDSSEWDDALEEANEGDSEDAIEQLLDMPMLSAYLDAGLSAFDLSCEGLSSAD